MSDYAIKIENLGKKYIIGHQRQNGYKTFRDVLVEKAKSAANLLLHPFSGVTGGPGADDYEEFWALNGVNLEIKAGERVGIIGRNGAGKSTLLKILSRITDPTSGDIWINGRVASLLEVGTGFHPELTGRENIYLNGAILGMGRVEIKRKFDEIVAFSEVEKFLDTPVKRYSSGMYVRLAFSVAAHLEPEILVVDEVLAVGDAAFQKKCLGKMEEVGKEGRTILFVSHNMAAIQNLCSRCVLLNKGVIETVGTAEKVINKYIESSSIEAKISIGDRLDRSGDGKIRFTALTLRDENNCSVNSLICGKKAVLSFSYKNNTLVALKNLNFTLGIDNLTGERITYVGSEICGSSFSELAVGVNSIDVCVEKFPFMPGRYGFTIYCSVNGVVADWIQNAGYFDVQPGDYYGTGKLPPSGQGNFIFDYCIYAG